MASQKDALRLLESDRTRLTQEVEELHFELDMLKDTAEKVQDRAQMKAMKDTEALREELTAQHEVLVCLDILQLKQDSAPFHLFITSVVICYRPSCAV